jgi:uncharacterized protein
MKKIDETKKILTYVVLTYFFSWILIPTASFVGALHNKYYMTAFIILYGFVPMIVALILHKLWYGKNIKKQWAINFHFNKWFFIGWLLPILYAFLTVVISLFFPNCKYNHVISNKFLIWSLVISLIAGGTVNAIVVFGEEAGWRGLIFKYFENKFYSGVIVIGIIWGVWIAPVIYFWRLYYPYHPFLGMAMMILVTILLSFILNYIRIRSKSIIAVCISHGTINAISGIGNVLVVFGDDITKGAFGVAGIISLIIVCLIIFICDIFFREKSIVIPGKI